MSRWPPEIAGTISHPAGRSAVTAERVPIFYSARSSSRPPPPTRLFSLFFSSFSLSTNPLALFLSLHAQGPQCVGPIQRLHENGSEPFPPRKRRTKGVAEDGRKHERKQMPRQRPTYLRYPLSCPSFSRFAPFSCFRAVPHPPPSFLSSNISVRGRGGCARGCSEGEATRSLNYIAICSRGWLWRSWKLLEIYVFTSAIKCMSALFRKYCSNILVLYIAFLQTYT